ncbi:SIR2 family NAD-dependent protein deacylase [Aureivirga sp. CE67]|uniref:SIR2 family NAD-dependent protein deacylase n=1 Tax=Aureivirga sp. CE67 TaxID=1788983 RepID=UPI0018CA04D0|nr:Sir2 family NAD-dependent protein deacetylase [Aureivirga sp. CE67]
MNWTKFEKELEKAIFSGKHITFLVGAGLSVESRIPTFRGKEGFWKIGSKNYKGPEIGTFRMFNLNAIEVWKWFLFRKTICRKAEPNRGHFILKEIEDLLGDQFALVSQNVDSLHKKAGNSAERTYLVHGDLDYARCGNECSDTLYPFPELEDKTRESDISLEEEKLLMCPKCGEYLRPHVLWFDETYNEEYYKIYTVTEIADNSSMLFIIGTSGSTFIPGHLIDRVSHFNQPILDINIADSEYSYFIKDYSEGYEARETSTEALEKVLAIIKKIKHENGKILRTTK